MRSTTGDLHLGTWELHSPHGIFIWMDSPDSLSNYQWVHARKPQADTTMDLGANRRQKDDSEHVVVEMLHPHPGRAHVSANFGHTLEQGHDLSEHSAILSGSVDLRIDGQERCADREGRHESRLVAQGSQNGLTVRLIDVAHFFCSLDMYFPEVGTSGY